MTPAICSEVLRYMKKEGEKQITKTSPERRLKTRTVKILMAISRVSKMLNN